MDAELLALESAFRSLQEQESAVKLSEANCVELISKLVSRGRLKLIYTLDGSEYVTEHHLGLEIQDEVMILAAGGRIEVVKLQSLLNVDLEHINRKVEELLSTDGSLKLVQGELVTQYYLDQVCLEIDEALKGVGEITVTALASRFTFSNDLIINLVKEATSRGVIHGVLEEGILYTQSFVNRERARLRGALAAITTPTPVQKLLLGLGMQKTLFYQFLDEMTQPFGALSGKRHNNETYVPNVFARTTEHYIRTFFKQNGWIPYERVAQALSIDNPQQWLKKAFPAGLALRSHFAEASLAEQLDAHVEEALQDDGYLDAQPLVPDPFSAEDVDMLLNLCQILHSDQWKGHVTVLNQRFVVASKFMDACGARLEPLVAEGVAAYAKAPIAATLVADNGPGDEEEVVVERKGKGGGGGGKKKGAPAAVPSSSSSRAAGKKALSSATGPESFLAVERCRQVLRDAYRDCEGEMLDAICDRLYKGLLARLAERCKSVTIVQASPLELTKEQLSQLIADFTAQSQNFDLFEAAATKLSVASLDSIMCKHLVKTTGTVLFNICLKLEASANKLAIGDPNDEKERTELLKRFPEESATCFQACLKTLNGSSLPAFKKALKTCSDLCQLRVKALDKKSEKQLVFAHRQGFIQQLQSEQDPTLALHLATVCSFAIHAELVLNVPSRCFPELIVVHKSLLPPDIADRLIALWGSLADPSNVIQALPELRELVTQKKTAKK